MTDNELLQAILDAVVDLKNATLLPPGLIGEGLNPWATRKVTTGPDTTVASIVQGPNFEVPLGFQVSCRMRHHTTTPGRLGYVAPSKEAVEQDGNRKVLKSNDSFTMRQGNFNHYWFWGDTASTVFELTVETSPA